MIILDDKFWEMGWFWVLDVLVEEVWGNRESFDFEFVVLGTKVFLEFDLDDV
jgi:hypothetical protein